jgi:D-alanine-D-alanine ligase
MNIVVVKDGSVCEGDGAGEAMPESAVPPTAQVVAEALADEGHSVAVCNADPRLAGILARMAGSVPDARASAMVFNLVRCGAGDAPRAQVPALLDMAGVPCTGPTPLGHVVGFDRLLARALLRQAGVPVAPCHVIRWPGHEPKLLQFPVAVAPRFHRPGWRLRLARNRQELVAAIEDTVSAEEQEALVCEHLDGVELSCSLLGNGDEIELLPIIERRDAEPNGPGHAAGLDTTPVGLQIGAMAAAAYKAVHCQDYGRVLVRFDRRGQPVVVGVDSMPRIDRDSNLIFAADAGGYGQGHVVSRILDTAHRRYFGTPAPRFDVSSARESPPALRLIS